MSSVTNIPSAASLLKEVAAIRKFWVGFLALGIAMVVFGTVAISWACLATLSIAATWLFGFLLLGGGIAEVINAFHAGRWSGTLIHLLIGLMYVVVGLMIIEQPEDSAIQITLIIAFFLIIGGIFRIVFSLSDRFPGWPWVLLNGGVSLLLGMMIYKQWPASGLWVIGLFVGIEMLFNGWSWIILALSLRRAPAATD